VTNDGSLQLRYAGVSVTTCTNAGFGTDGTVVHATGSLGSAAGTALFGSQTQGAQTGDRVLAASDSEVCASTSHCLPQRATRSPGKDILPGAS
jgi:hypothetical protein